MEGAEGNQICCCGPKIWTRVIGWVQLVFMSLLGISVTGEILIPMLTTTSDQPQGESEVKVHEADLYALVGLVTLAVGIGLSILFVTLLLIGNEKERSGFLWPWLIVHWITTVLSGLGALVALFILQIFLCICLAVQALLAGFFLYVVHQRREEMLAMEGEITVGVYAQI